MRGIENVVVTGKNAPAVLTEADLAGSEIHVQRALRQKAAAVGLDPNQWFGNVEIIAGRVIGGETVDYVGNVYKYYSASQAVAAQRGVAVPAPQ